MKTVHLLIRGKVQGVFYRVSAKETAYKLEVKGWVKNTKAGDVEAIASGELEKVNSFIKWCKKGPPEAQVKDVIITEYEYQEFTDFTIKR